MKEDTETTAGGQFRSQPLEPLSYSIKGTMAVTGLGRSLIFAMLADGRLKRVKIGKRTLIPRASIEALISGQSA